MLYSTNTTQSWPQRNWRLMRLPKSTMHLHQREVQFWASHYQILILGSLRPTALLRNRSSAWSNYTTKTSAHLSWMMSLHLLATWNSKVMKRNKKMAMPKCLRLAKMMKTSELESRMSNSYLNFMRCHSDATIPWWTIQFWKSQKSVTSF